MIKHCNSCGIAIQKLSRQWAVQKYCSDRCRKQKHRRHKTSQSRVERRKANLLQNDEILYIIRQCRRAGTIQILHGHDLESFTITMELIKARPPGDVHLCHIFPVKDRQAVGLLHYYNLFYAGAYQNRLYGNSHASGGLSIPISALNKKWAVSPHITNNEILLLIETYLDDVIPAYLMQNSVLKSRKANIIAKIREIDNSISQEELFQHTYHRLDAIWSKMSHAQSKLPKPENESKYIVYMDSLTRFITYSSKNKKTLEAVRKLMAIVYRALSQVSESMTFNKWFYVSYGYLIPKAYMKVTLRDPSSWSILKDLVYDAAFGALQGKHIDVAKLKRDILKHIYK